MEVTNNKKIVTILITILVSLCMVFVICFNAFALSTSFNRPWNTPERAISGGAQFLAEDYISQGQYNPYLKRFNVVPTNPGNIFSHQYMTDIRGVMFEAASSFKSFQQNGLLSLPLVFDIPVYENMDHTYHYPISGVSSDNYGSQPYHDQAFVQEMREKGFPDLYIGQLADLHAKYPNWTFNPIITNIDFEYAVSMEKNVSYINIVNSQEWSLMDPNYPNPVEGSNWYMASWDTVAFFMDPRNMLDESSILMFYSSKFSDIYSVSAVQSVLNGTFMSGTESISGKSYATLFYEAGKKANVNPVYLASLSKHEVGVNGSIATSGGTYTYQGMVYHDLYNFFNIGAYSSAENPVLAGLVYANGGAEESNNAYKEGSQPSVPDIPDSGTGDSGSGDTTEDSRSKGDVNNDGKISVSDYVLIRNHINQLSLLSEEDQWSADVNGDGKISVSDYVLVRNHINGISTIG